MKHIQTAAEWEEEMSKKILHYLRNDLYLELRFMDVALSGLEWKKEDSLATFGTDGSNLYYSAEQLLRVFQTNTKFLCRAYLHSILHCLYSHLWIRQGRQPELWNLACDISVEYTIDRMEKQGLTRPLSWIRQNFYEQWENENRHMSAASIYNYLLEYDSQKLEKLVREFYTDSHIYWPKEEQGSAGQSETAAKWDKIARQTDMEVRRRGDENETGEDNLLCQMKAGKSRRTYREFLRKFSVLKEEVHCNEDEFDMNYYTYGLQLYGNMPLIEPLESREVMKIQEFVIALDTSYSTSGELIKNFLRETFGILSDNSSFFYHCRIRILQCDDRIRMDKVISNREDLESLLQEFEISGGGGTDFRPVFRYVDALIKEGKIRELRGLLYFTDGKGIYPKKPPHYQTAFLFLDEFEESKIPPWAIRMRLEPEEFKERKAERRYEY